MQVITKKIKVILLTESEQKILSELLDEKIESELILNDSESASLFNRLIDIHSEDVEIRGFLMKLGKELKK